MSLESQQLFSGLWSSIREGLISMFFPSDWLHPIEKAAQYISTKFEQNVVLEADMLLKQTTLKTIIGPEDHYQRLYLRSLAGLPAIPKTTNENHTNVTDLKGCLSWVSKGKIDVTELIREIRDS
jgi:SH3-like domain-containing protein